MLTSVSSTTCDKVRRFSGFANNLSMVNRGEHSHVITGKDSFICDVTTGDITEQSFPRSLRRDLSSKSIWIFRKTIGKTGMYITADLVEYSNLLTKINCSDLTRGLYNKLQCFSYMRFCYESTSKPTIAKIT